MNNSITLQEIVDLQGAFWNQMNEDKLILNGVSAFVTLIKDPFLNLALYNGFTSEITPKDIDKVINQVNNFFVKHNIVWTWCLNPIPGADLLVEGLKRNNYVFFDLYVTPEFRKQNIGRLLMRTAKNYAIESNINKIILSTENSNYIGQKLYESEGYQKDTMFSHYTLNINNVN